MTLSLKLKSWFNFTLDLVYPPKCAGCDKMGDGLWCPQCAQKVHLLLAPDHIKLLTLTEGITVPVLSAAEFASPIREAIHEFKYNGTPALAEPLSKHMVMAWQRVNWSIDLIIPVPLHGKRRRERGYNQSEFLAAEMARMIKMPMNPSALLRTRNTEQQAHLGAEARQHNVADAFAAVEGIVQGKHILLLDDVFTTGATLRACALSLLQSKATNVYAMTLARA